MYKGLKYLALFIVVALFFSCKKERNTTPTREPTDPGTHILFDADETFNNGLTNAPSPYTTIYYCKLDGTGITPVTSLDPTHYSYRASWSADGTKVIFTRGNKSDSDRSLCVMDVPGGNFTAIVNGNKVDYGSFSPSGKMVAYAKCLTVALPYPYDLFVAKVNGASEQQLTYFANDDGAVANIHWATDGKIYFNAGGSHHQPGIYSIDTTGNNLKFITSGGDFLGVSRDAQHLLYDLVDGLYTCNADGTNVKKIVVYDNSTPNTLLGGTWSADGTQIYLSYTDYPDGLFGIYKINSDGSGLKKILAGFYEYPNIY